MALHLAGMSGSSARSQRTPEEQAVEFRVLDYLAGSDGEFVREQVSALRPLVRRAKSSMEWSARNGLLAKTSRRSKMPPAPSGSLC